MTSYKEQSLKAKKVKEGIIEQRSVGGKSNKDKPIIVEFKRYSSLEDRICHVDCDEGFKKCGHYRNLREAKNALNSLKRKYPFYAWRISVPDEC